MSTFTFPYWAKPVLDFYNLKWPDVDEDAVAQMGHEFAQVADAAFIFSLAVRTSLDSLAADSRSTALTSMHEEWAAITADLESITDSIGSAAVASTLAVANGITIYKGSVLGVLTFNVGSDIALIATGVGAAAVVAKKMVMREILELALEEAARQTAAWLITQWNDAIDELVLGPLEKLAADIGRELGGAAGRIAALAVPIDAIAGAGSALYIDHHEIIDAVGRVATAYHRLETAIDRFCSMSTGTGYTVPTPLPDVTVSLTVKQAFDWAATAFGSELKRIGQEIVDRIIDIITDTYDAYVEADTELGALAVRLREQFSVPVVTAPFVIDRSTRPKPIMVLDAPPPVVTGQGYSDAREHIVAMDLGASPDPVVTGVAQSDARSRIRRLVLDEAPEPVVTGLAESDARESIKPLS